MKFKDLRIGTKQILGFGSILIIMVAVNIFSITGLNSLKSEIDDFDQNWLRRAIAFEEINYNSSNLRRQQLQYAFAKNKKNKEDQKDLQLAYIEKIDQNIDRYKTLREKYRNPHQDFSKEDSLYQSFDEKWENYLSLSIQFLQLSQQNKDDEALNLLNGEASIVFEDFSNDLSALVKICELNVVNSAEMAARTYKGTHFVTMLFLIIAIILSIFLTIMIVRLILVPVYRMENAAKKIASGDLDTRVKITSNDELGNLSKSFNTMTTALKEAREKENVQTQRLRMQWDVLYETNKKLEENSKSLENQKIKIERKNKQLELAMNKLKEAQNQLVQSEKMASIGQLTAGIAHEINNPINFVSSNISPLKRDLDDIIKLLELCTKAAKNGELDKECKNIENFKVEIEYDLILTEVKQLLNGIEEGAKRTMEIVRGLRNFSRLDEGEKKLADINEGIDSTLLMLRNQLKNRIEVIKNYGSLPQFLCYPGKLNQVFMNIINNASQSIEGDGLIEISTWFKNKSIFISIKDNGIGMPKKVIDHIFEPFYTTKDVGKGTGLGLSISYGIVQEHKGDIQVKSSPGKGTEFIITLPVED